MAHCLALKRVVHNGHGINMLHDYCMNYTVIPLKPHVHVFSSTLLLCQRIFAGVGAFGRRANDLIQ